MSSSWDWISKNSGDNQPIWWSNTTHAKNSKIIALGGEEWDIVETASSRCVKKRPRPPFHPTEIFTKLVRLSAAGSGSHSICKKSHGMSWLSANQYHCMILWSPIFFGAWNHQAFRTRCPNGCAEPWSAPFAWHRGPRGLGSSGSVGENGVNQPNSHPNWENIGKIQFISPAPLL